MSWDRLALATDQLKHHLRGAQLPGEADVPTLLDEAYEAGLAVGYSPARVLQLVEHAVSVSSMVHLPRYAAFQKHLARISERDDIGH